MLILFYIFGFILFNQQGTNDKSRILEYNGVEYQTTYSVPEAFIGVYKGRKSGYLKLNTDGTGVYKYDLFGFAPASCEHKPIELVWGFILNANGDIIKNKRYYGYSYPILLKSTGGNSFQGCRKVIMKDFILDKGNTLHVSSSDDWQKEK